MTTVELSAGANNVIVDLQGYGAGVYLYLLVGKDGRSATKRLIVE